VFYVTLCCLSSFIVKLLINLIIMFRFLLPDILFWWNKDMDCRDEYTLYSGWSDFWRSCCRSLRRDSESSLGQFITTSAPCCLYSASLPPSLEWPNYSCPTCKSFNQSINQSFIYLHSKWISKAKSNWTAWQQGRRLQLPHKNTKNTKILL